MLLAMEDELERVLGPEVTLTLEPDDDPWTVHCDREGLERLVLNLALNAREAMPGGGSLRIGAANVGEAMAGARRPQEARPGPYVCLTFEDTGGGMDPEVRRRMFEPFFTTKGAGLGNGLGLAVVHGIVTHHGGWIDVESERGRGTAIRVHLPARTGAVFLEEERPAGGRRAGGAARILVVEDDDGARRFAVRALERAGYEVTAARDVSGALLHLAGGRRFDLVFSDLVLPDGDGARLVEQIVDREPDVGVVLTSGCARDGGTLQRIRDRRWTFLQKPYALGALVEAVRKNVPRR
jgi:CheY-like chemotaxis protein